MKILVTSDWHADARTAGFERGADVEHAALETVEAAVAEQCDLYVFLGDLSDPDSAGVHKAGALAVMVASGLWFGHGIPSRWITGNHDVVEDGSGSHTLMGLVGLANGLGSSKHAGQVGVMATPFVENFQSHGVDVLYLPFAPRSHAYDPEEWVRKCGERVGRGRMMVVLSHLNVEGIEPGSETSEMPRGREVFLPLSAIRRRWPRALVLNGHYHRRQTFQGVVIPGSLERLTFGEEHNSPGYLVVEV